MKRSPPESVAVAPVVMLPLSLEQAHLRLGHMSEEATRKATKTIGWKLMTGSMVPCESCAIGKGRQKNSPKDNGGQEAKLKQSRVYLDCTSFKDRGSNKVIGVWRLMVFYPSQLKITEIFQSMSAMVESTVEKLGQMCRLGVGPIYLRMDNAGENKILADRIQHKHCKLPIIVEWTARDPPKQNSPAEVGFVTLSGRARAMLQQANIPNELRKTLMPEAVKTATHLDGLIPQDIDGVVKTRFEHQFGENPPFARSLRIGERQGL
jgi:hypothetical protein